MAATAEALYIRSPESEVYGRSLSAIRQLGALMVNATCREVVNSPEADQARIEFYTSVEEGFGTDEQLGGGLEVRDYDERPIIDGRVMSKDLKRAVSDMTDAGLACARKTAKKDERFLPQLTRSIWDHENALEVDRMARGETDYNTRIVVSPFPEEAAAVSGNEYWRDIGYVPSLKRGFVQLYYGGNSYVLSGSLSFDGSNKQQLKQIFQNHGIDIPEGEITDNWLKYAITATLSENEAKALATSIANQANNREKNTNTVDVTRGYKEVMDTVFNDSYIHICESLFRGYQTNEVAKLINQFANNAQYFNDRYSKALYKMQASKDQFTDEDSAILHELLVYSTIEMMRALHLKSVDTNTGSSRSLIIGENIQSVDPLEFQRMLSDFGASGAANNRTYSACGLSISLGDGNEKNNPQTVFGGLDISSSDEETSSWQWKTGHCRVDNCPTRPNATEVGPCDVCKGCQRHFDKGQDPAKLYKALMKRVQKASDKLFGSDEESNKKRASAWLN